MIAITQITTMVFFRPMPLVKKLAVIQPKIQPAIGVPLATEIQVEGSALA